MEMRSVCMEVPPYCRKTGEKNSDPRKRKGKLNEGKRNGD